MKLLRMNRLALLRWVALANMIGCGILTVGLTTVVDGHSALSRAMERAFFVLGAPVLRTLWDHSVPGFDNPVVALLWVGGGLIVNAYLWGLAAWLAVSIAKRATVRKESIQQANRDRP